MAGGRGTRISSIAGDLPKPMLPVDGKPVLEHELACLRDQGFTEIILTVSHLRHVIMDYFGDDRGWSPATGKPFGVEITYFCEETPLGNAGALFQMRDKLSDDFLLLNADSIFDVDFHRFVDVHRRKGGLATLFTHPNDHPYDSGLIIADQNGRVTNWLPKECERDFDYRNRVNAGLHVLSPKLLDARILTERVDLDRQLLRPLAGTGELIAYDSPEYVKDMGTPERYTAVCRDFQSGKVQARNMRNRQRAIFLDRDGTLNRHVGFVTEAPQLELLPGVAEAVRNINQSRYLAIVVTNQPVIARGEVTIEELDNIHNRLETLLGQEGAYVDAIYYCPHHPHKGYSGERPEYKIDCDCRKPNPGLLLRAAENFNIDLAASWMVGDSESDIQAGKSAGCRTALLHGAEEFGQNLTCKSLLDFVSRILAEE